MYGGLSGNALMLVTFQYSKLNVAQCVGRCGGLMVSALDSGASAPGSRAGRGHCVVFLGKTLYSHGASLHPGPGCSKPG